MLQLVIFCGFVHNKILNDMERRGISLWQLIFFWTHAITFGRHFSPPSATGAARCLHGKEGLPF